MHYGAIIGMLPMLLSLSSLVFCPDYIMSLKLLNAGTNPDSTLGKFVQCVFLSFMSWLASSDDGIYPTQSSLGPH